MITTERRVLFRADASPVIGGGHLARCVALAQAFEFAGWVPYFAFRTGSLETLPGLLTRGSTTLELDETDDIVQINHRWPDPFQLVVVDHYGLDAAFEHRISELADRALAIEDNPNRTHVCDVLLDQTYGREAGEYTLLVPSGCQVLVGSKFALLRKEFHHKRADALKRRRGRPAVERILVTLGAADTTYPTVLAIEAIAASNVTPHVHVEIVLGGGIADLGPVRVAAQQLPCSHSLQIGTYEIADLMVNADIAIGAAGSSAWERCCLGLPTIMMVIAENQATIAENLDRNGAAVTIGPYENSDCTNVADAITSLMNDTKQRIEMTEAAACICDGLGARRVVEALLG